MPLIKNRFASNDVMKYFTAFHPHSTWQAQTFMEFCMVVVQRVHRHNQLQGWIKFQIPEMEHHNPAQTWELLMNIKLEDILYIAV